MEAGVTPSGQKRKRPHETCTPVAEHLQPSSETRAKEIMQSNPHTPVAEHPLIEENEGEDYGHCWEYEGDDTEGSIEPGMVDGCIHGEDTRQFRSKVWNEFSKIREAGLVMKGQCIHCNVQISAKKGAGTSAMLTHLKRCKVRRNVTNVSHQLAGAEVTPLQEEQQATDAKAAQEIAHLQGQLQQANATVAKFMDCLVATRAENAQLKEKYASEIAKLNQKHASEVAKLQEEHASTAHAEKVKAEHTAEIAKLHEKHAAEVAKLNQVHASEVTKRQKEHHKANTALAKKVKAEHTIEIAKLQEKHATEVAKLNQAHDAAITWLMEEHEVEVDRVKQAAKAEAVDVVQDAKKEIVLALFPDLDAKKEIVLALFPDLDASLL